MFIPKEPRLGMVFPAHLCAHNRKLRGSHRVCTFVYPSGKTHWTRLDFLCRNEEEIEYRDDCFVLPRVADDPNWPTDPEQVNNYITELMLAETAK